MWIIEHYCSPDVWYNVHRQILWCSSKMWLQLMGIKVMQTANNMKTSHWHCKPECCLQEIQVLFTFLPSKKCAEMLAKGATHDGDVKALSEFYMNSESPSQSFFWSWHLWIPLSQPSYRSTLKFSRWVENRGLYRDFKGLPQACSLWNILSLYSSFMEKTSHMAGLPFLPRLHDVLDYLIHTGLLISCHPNVQPDEAKGLLRYTGSLCESYAEKSGISSSVLMCPILCPKDVEYNQSPTHILITFYHLKCKTWNCTPGPL